LKPTIWYRSGIFTFRFFVGFVGETYLGKPLLLEFWGLGLLMTIHHEFSQLEFVVKLEATFDSWMTLRNLCLKEDPWVEHD